MAQIKIDDAVFDKLAEILKKHNLNEIEYKSGDIRIRLAAGVVEKPRHSQPTIEKVVPIDASEEKVTNKESDWKSHPGAVKSPMVGTCYLAPEPGANNFVSVGDSVQKDQPILIIEAMKVMNLIKAPKAGKVIHIAVSNADPIEYGQLLVVIE